MGLRKKPYSEGGNNGKRSAPTGGSGAKKSNFKTGFSKGDKPAFGAKRPGFGSSPARGGFKKSEGGSDERRSSSPRPYTKRSEGGSDERRPSRFGSDSGDKRSSSPRPYTKRSEGGSDERRPSRFGSEGGDRRSSSPRPYTKRSEGGSDERRPSRFGSEGGDRRSSSPRPYTKRSEGGSDEKRPSRFGSEGGDRRSSSPRPYTKRSEGGSDERRPSRFGSDSGDRRSSSPRPYTKRSEGGSDDRRPSRFGSDSGDRRSSSPRPYTKRSEGGSDERRPSRFGSDSGDRRSSSPRPYTKRSEGGSDDRRPSRFNNDGDDRRSGSYDNEEDKDFKPARTSGKSGRPYMVKGAKARDLKAKSDEMLEAASPDIVRLNRYISNAGICSRREADDLISAGLVAVNGEIITEMGYKVKPSDEIRYNNTRLSWEKKVYLLMNKPKDTITTSDDPDGRKIIMDLIKDPRLPRVYPVGRLDRNTTGVIVLTNDGELAQRLTHPKYNVTKVYKAVLNKAFAAKDLQELGTNGVELEDGPIKPDVVGIPSANEKDVVMVQIHSGRNHIIHRMFEAMGYLVNKLDRLDFAGLERKGLDRGEWRHLEEKEIKKLKKLVQLK
ncbi:MAG: pseudouridine synthase [Bacteroidia bacterium]|nr:pseudouridine synthase [Bacteroidia bacterium]